jgi:diguanylate cyclase (GGDEF)-like protein/PAS domain S-box-containing protein
VHPDDFASTKQSMAALSDQIPVLNFTNRYLTSDGDYRFIEWRSYPSGKYIYAAARDITDRINYELELNKLAERLTLATGSAGIGIWDWDIANDELIWDHQMYKLYGMVEDSSINVYKSWQKAVHPEDRDYIESLFAEGMKGLSLFTANFRVVWPGGELHYLEAHALVIRDKNERAVRVTGVSRDVTENKKMEEQLLILSTTDPLTMAYNRRYLLHMLNSEISRAVRYNAVFSLIMFDIDHFKNVNDTYGHDAGDEVLKSIVTMMQKRIRKNDILARWGGEEFMILLSGTNLVNAGIFADKLINEVRDLVFERSGKITASFGVAEYIMNETQDSFLKRVDEMVYKAKSEGRNCVRY